MARERRRCRSVSIRGRFRASEFADRPQHHFELALDGGERTQAMIVDWQYEPIKGALLHIDLKRIAMDQKLHGPGADRAERRSARA